MNFANATRKPCQRRPVVGSYPRQAPNLTGIERRAVSVAADRDETVGQILGGNAARPPPHPNESVCRLRDSCLRPSRRTPVLHPTGLVSGHVAAALAGYQAPPERPFNGLAAEQQQGARARHQSRGHRRLREAAAPGQGDNYHSVRHEMHHRPPPGVQRDRPAVAAPIHQPNA
jgi:hypothetical protein